MPAKQNAALRIYEEIRERIATLAYAPGSILNEGELAEEFGVSKTPVREALHKLEQDRLLHILPKVGAQVIPFDIMQMRQAYDVKRTLEGMAARLAAERLREEEKPELEEILDRLQGGGVQEPAKLDEAVHAAVSRLAGNDTLEEINGLLSVRFRRFGNYVGQYLDIGACILATLPPLVQAVLAGDGAAAEKAAMAHIDACMEQIKKDFL